MHNRNQFILYNSYFKTGLIFLILSLNLFSIKVFAQQRKYTVANGHAHNDYNHPVPFYTAYNAGFGSIEADIILKNDQLYVAHDTIDINPKRTLQSLYLDPMHLVNRALPKNE